MTLEYSLVGLSLQELRLRRNLMCIASRRWPRGFAKRPDLFWKIIAKAREARGTELAPQEGSSEPLAQSSLSPMETVEEPAACLQTQHETCNEEESQTVMNPPLSAEERAKETAALLRAKPQVQARLLAGMRRYAASAPPASPSDAPTVALLVLRKEGMFSRMQFDRWAKFVPGLLRISPKQLLDGWLEGCKMLIVPGGSIFEYEAAIGNAGSDAICRFVSGGGGYVGTCCGAFLASRVGYDGAQEQWRMLGVSSGPYVAGKGRATCSVTDVGRKVLGDLRKPFDLHYQNGMTFSETTLISEALPAATPLLQLHALNLDKRRWVPSAPTYAAVAGEFGRGRVVVFGPHPEATGNDEATCLLQNALDWCLDGHAPRATS
eukprot:gnl/MRDRNA2_/MRDRNA2_95080_c0_seq1.p1 gnl/MRDRNA2_/MRDRNA2_95080_c0~~gnl/MRDRNA2_/MRDRNA2_95080_c0_seq1.p1  ORF type:complete len:378 (+),score=54.05 gnl/MRDRNA2_/MRDRNA2_95080_c0_seq1:208-1341(+)